MVCRKGFEIIVDKIHSFEKCTEVVDEAFEIGDCQIAISNNLPGVVDARRYSVDEFSDEN